MGENSFGPTVNRVGPCDQIVLRNNGTQTHSLGLREVSEEERSVGEWLVGPSETWPLLFNVPGTFYVYCKVHAADWMGDGISGMHFRVSVDTTGALPPAETDGS